MPRVGVFDITLLRGSLVLAKPQKLHETYDSRLQHLLRCYERIERLAHNNYVGKGDLHLIYEATFLGAMAALEHFLESFLVECVCGMRSRKRGHYSLVKPKNRRCFEDILFGPSGHVNMLPYRETLRNASLYLNEGLPFKNLPEQMKLSLNEGALIRNAIAHHSSKALRAFQEKVPGVQSLSKRRQRPGPFLRNVFRHSPKQRRIDHYFGSFRRIAHYLVSNW